jgi:hydroxymethylpyrimidine/phosphomethylpyrimidine kinase
LFEWIKNSIKEAVKKIEETENFVSILPEVGTNIVMAPPEATSLSEVVALTGRIIKVENRAVGVGEPKSGASTYMGTVLISAKRRDAEISAAINIKYNESILNTCNELKMEPKTFVWDIKPKEAVEFKCTIPWTIEKLGKVPEIVYDIGDFGVEASMIIFGKTAIEVADKAIKIATHYAKNG